MHTSTTMAPSEQVYRNLRNARAVLLNQGLTHIEVDNAMRESFAAFYAGIALESGVPRKMVALLLESVESHLDNQGMSAAVRLPAKGIFSRLFHRPAQGAHAS